MTNQNIYKFWILNNTLIYLNINKNHNKIYFISKLNEAYFLNSFCNMPTFYPPFPYISKYFIFI